MIGEQTADVVGSAFRLRELDKVQVVGRTQALRIYELLGVAGAALLPEQAQMLALYAEALAAYRSQRWDEATEHFGKCLTLWPKDGPSRRCGNDAARCAKPTCPTTGTDRTST